MSFEPILLVILPNGLEDFDDASGAFCSFSSMFAASSSDLGENKSSKNEPVSEGGVLSFSPSADAPPNCNPFNFSILFFKVKYLFLYFKYLE